MCLYMVLVGRMLVPYIQIYMAPLIRCSAIPTPADPMFSRLHHRNQLKRATTIAMIAWVPIPLNQLLHRILESEKPARNAEIAESKYDDRCYNNSKHKNEHHHRNIKTEYNLPRQESKDLPQPRVGHEKSRT